MRFIVGFIFGAVFGFFVAEYISDEALAAALERYDVRERAT